MMSGDSSRVYEILQPHLRRVQSLGVRLDRVPSHDATDVEVDRDCAILLNRALSLLTSNAVNAGASRLTIDLRLIDGGTRVLLAVTDDAGGFDFGELPAGRGLSTLLRQIGTSAVQRYDAPGGSMMVVTVARSLDDAPATARRDISVFTDRHAHRDLDSDRAGHRAQFEHRQRKAVT